MRPLTTDHLSNPGTAPNGLRLFPRCWVAGVSLACLAVGAATWGPIHPASAAGLGGIVDKAKKAGGTISDAGKKTGGAISDAGKKAGKAVSDAAKKPAAATAGSQPAPAAKSGVSYPGFHPDDYLAFRIWKDSKEVGMRIGHPVLAHEIGKLSPYYQKDTDYNKIKAYDFQYAGLDAKNKEIKIKAKINYRKYEKYPPPLKGRYQSYNQTWGANCGVQLSVANGRFAGKGLVRKVESGWAGGPLGWIAEIFDTQFRILGFVIDGKDPGKLSDAMISTAAFLATASKAATTVKERNEYLSALIEQRVIFAKDVRFDNKGVWFVFGYSSPNAEKVSKLISSFPLDHVAKPGEDQVHFRYTIRNATDQPIRFRLPSGKDYTLAAGQKGSYVFTGRPPKAAVYVYNTSRSYRLTEGDHKFWWMPKEKRIGLDIAGR